MNRLFTLNKYNQLLEENKRLFNSPIIIQTKHGNKNWKATPESLETVFVNLKRSIANKSHINELDKLFIAISNNKFESRFKIFIKSITNNLATASDVNLGCCPQLDKSFSKNSHEHTKYFLVYKIINWYINYYTWCSKMKSKLKDEVDKKDKTPEVDEKDKTPEVDEKDEDWEIRDEIPDCWDI